jgi:DNA-binding winged helix-turn-helix (wHTH) protein
VLFLFEDFALDCERRELRAGDAVIPVEPQVFDILVHLVENRDRVVSKDDLIASVWNGRIVSDSTLDSRINAVRKAVGDSGGQQRLVRTMSRTGFRFVGAVTSKGKPGKHGILRRHCLNNKSTFARSPTESASPTLWLDRDRLWSRQPTGSTISNTIGKARSGASFCTNLPHHIGWFGMTNAATDSRTGMSTIYRSKHSFAISKTSSMRPASTSSHCLAYRKAAPSRSLCHSPSRAHQPSRSVPVDLRVAGPGAI